MSKINKIILEEIEALKNQMRVMIMLNGREKEFNELNQKLAALLYSLDTDDLLNKN